MTTATHRMGGPLPAALRHTRHFFVAAAAFSGVLNLVLLAPSLYMLQVYDRVLSTRSVETLVMLSLVTAGALVLMAVLDALRGRLLALAAALFERRVAAMCLQRLLDGGVATSPAAPHALRDVAQLRGFFAGPGLVALFDAPWMPVYLGVVFLFSPWLGLLATASAAVLVLLAVLGEHATRSGVERAQQGSRELGRFIDGALRAGEVVRALGMAGAVGARWHARHDALQARQLRTQRLAGLAGSATKGFRQSVQVVMLATAAWLVIEQKATPGVMIAVTVILGRALAPVELLIGQWRGLAEARAAWGRLQALLGEAAPPVPTALPLPSGALLLDGVVHQPPGATRPVLRQLSLQVAPGELLAVVGPSGSGKSTLARLMLGLVRPQAGTVRLDGAELSHWAPERLGPLVGYVPQDVALLDGTVAENIARHGVGADPAAVVLAAQRAHAHEMILGLPQGYDTPVGEAGQRLSGGQRQRVALARALYGEPRLLVLDEPNAHLDSEGEQALVRALAGLRERGATVVLVTQRTQILSAVDRIVVLRDGVIERIGLRQDKTIDQPAGAGLHAVPVLHPA